MGESLGIHEKQTHKSQGSFLKKTYRWQASFDAVGISLSHPAISSVIFPHLFSSIALNSFCILCFFLLANLSFFFSYRYHLTGLFCFHPSPGQSQSPGRWPLYLHRYWLDDGTIDFEGSIKSSLRRVCGWRSAGFKESRCRLMASAMAKGRNG